jgi:23S rRNA (uracil1939-C5)-methyltransferase
MPPRSRKQRLPTETFSAHVDALAHDGRGIARVGGKAVLLQDALPGEEVQFRYTARHNRYDEGATTEIHHPSPDRVAPRCPHFGLCGGCHLQHLDSARQIACKQTWLLDNLTRIGKVQPEEIFEPLTGPPWGYRRKARLGVKHVPKKGRVLVGFREHKSPYVADLTRCEVLHPRVGHLLTDLGFLVQSLSIYNRLPQIEVAVGDDAVVALSFRVLDPPTETDRAALIEFGRHHDIQIHLQPKGPDTTHRLWPEQARLSYRLPGYDLELDFEPFHFTQVNTDINRPMVDRALNLLEITTEDRILDLFCGLGNFTLPLARRAGAVVGVEGDSALVASAQRNAERNAVDNARFFVTDLTGDVGDALWARGHYDKIILDPPRSGALEVLERVAVLSPRRVVYVSCHPATLARDAGELVNRFGYRLLGAGVMDMFPHTAHVESIALFGKI